MTEHTHRCPSPNCNVQVPRKHFACREHWRSLPPNHQNAITSAKRGSGEHGRAMYEAMQWMKTAETA